MEVAACHGRDTERWFSTYADTREEAKKICLTKCSKRIECLAFALQTEPPGYRREGIFGGMEPTEREALAKRLKELKEQEEKNNG